MSIILKGCNIFEWNSGIFMDLDAKLTFQGQTYDLHIIFGIFSDFWEVQGVRGIFSPRCVAAVCTHSKAP